MVYRGKERRKYQRYNLEAKVYFCVEYDLTTIVKFRVSEARKGRLKPKKYVGISNNICAEGIRFHSDKKLKKGDRLFLEVYLPKRQRPIPMTGIVHWSKQLYPYRKKYRFDTGVKLISVKGKSVLRSIRIDPKYGLYWSTVLESVLGGFRKSLHRRLMRVRGYSYQPFKK